MDSLYSLCGLFFLVGGLVVQTNAQCGSPSSPIEVVGSSGTITSPNYPSSHPNNLNCAWRLNALPGQNFGAVLNDVCTESCCDYLRAYDGPTTGSTRLGEWRGCLGAINQNLTSTGYQMLFTFYSDSSVTQRGFSLSWQREGFSCGNPTTPTLITGPSGTLTSPNYPNNYPNGLNCAWLFDAPENQIIAITFNDFCSETCCDYMRVYDGPDTSSNQLFEFRGCPAQTQDFASTGNQLLVTFFTDSSVLRRGFSLNWQFVSACGSPDVPRIFTTPTGSLASPNYPGNYDRNHNCGWRLQAPAGERITVSFLDFCTEGCCDHLDIFDGPTTESRQLRRHNGCTLPADVSSFGNSMLFRFTTDNTIVNRGFNLTWQFSECGSDAEPIAITSPTDGSITSPNYPSNYVNGLRCAWRITGGTNQVVRLTFSDFCTESCCDHLRIYDGSTSSHPLVRTHNGCSIPPDYTSSGQNVFVTFSTDGSVTNRGFNMSWVYETQAVTVTEPPVTTPNPIPCGSPTDPIDYSTFTGFIESPLYPNNYPNNLNCGWRITSYVGQVVLAVFEDFCTEGCCDHLRIYDGPTTASPLLLLHNGCTLPNSTLSTNRQMLITFTTDGSVSHSGFRMRWELEHPNAVCGSTQYPLEYTAPSGTISSPNYPNNYYNNLNCGWRFIAPTGDIVRISFSAFCLESCCDYVRAYDGPTTGHRRILSRNGCSSIPGDVSSTSNNLLVTFTSDGSVVRSGFQFTWTFSSTGTTVTVPTTQIEITAAATTPAPSTCGTEANPIFVDGPDTNGKLSSPGYPDGYENGLRCHWLFRAGTSQTINVQFSDICTQANADYVRFHNGETTGHTLMGQFSGCNRPEGSLTSSGNRMMMTFFTDSATTNRGFEIEYNFVTAPQLP